MPDQAMVKVTFSDGNSEEHPRGTSFKEIIEKKGNLPRSIIAVKANGELLDLHATLAEDAAIELIDIDSVEGQEILRHSTSHVMAQAVQDLYPGVKITIGPSIENGFYYDFDYERPFNPEDLEKIEARMNEIIKDDIPIKRELFSKQEALSFFKDKGELYKVELIEELPDGNISAYTQNGFTDLCRGPHLPSTGRIKAFKLTSVAGAYWRGDEKNKMLQRIYGTAFADKKKLKQHLQQLEEAKKRDHRKLGKELELFSIHDEVGAGLVIYHPKGALLRRLLEDFEVREHLKRGYQLVKGPQILKVDMWKKSGHLDHYKENMYFTDVEEQQYGLKPMNCVAHMLIYQSKIRSYRDLPQRYFELGTVHRHERAGVLHGLPRVREFTQ
ncbi:MAG: threonine--tRNA ligase, partial [Thermodesulfobacteriota bacterium]|nr:threonine--tRNA ligase [Thermodesulfobacteriota bacterium]